MKERSRSEGSSVGTSGLKCRAIPADILKSAKTECAKLFLESKTLPITSRYLLSAIAFLEFVLEARLKEGNFY